MLSLHYSVQLGGTVANSHFWLVLLEISIDTIPTTEQDSYDFSLFSPLRVTKAHFMCRKYPVP